MHGSWSVVDGEQVRLRSTRIGLVSIDVTAPVTHGDLQIAPGSTRLTLTIALDRLRTGNLLLQSAARSLVSSNGGQELRYVGTGTGGLQVAGVAKAGTIEVELGLDLVACGPAEDPMSQLVIGGSANLGTVTLPLPGLGTVRDFTFSVEARVRMIGR